MNPGSIGWAYVDSDGNLKAKGQIPLQMGLPSGKQDAQIVDACLQLAALATTYACPVVCEELDFTEKKKQLGERGRKYARMLSGWAYSRFYQLLGAILANRGVDLLTVNPAYSSLIGLVKYSTRDECLELYRYVPFTDFCRFLEAVSLAVVRSRSLAPIPPTPPAMPLKIIFLILNLSSAVRVTIAALTILILVSTTTTSLPCHFPLLKR